jgi:hypothetical protein
LTIPNNGLSSPLSRHGLWAHAEAVFVKPPSRLRHITLRIESRLDSLALRHVGAACPPRRSIDLNTDAYLRATYVSGKVNLRLLPHASCLSPPPFIGLAAGVTDVISNIDITHPTPGALTTRSRGLLPLKLAGVRPAHVRRQHGTACPKAAGCRHWRR